MPLIDAGALRAFASSLLQANGLLAQHAHEVADVLVWADLRGVDSHGVSRLPLYVKWLRSGEMNSRATLHVALQMPALQVLDAHEAPGAVAMKAAANAATRLARDCGVGMVMVRGTTHTGSLGYYTSSIASEGLVGLALSASGPNMIYHGAAAPGVSTAPLSIAVPRRGGAPVVFDMASSAIAFGRLQEARAEHRQLPPGVAADASGVATTDPDAAVAPLPLGGAKGSGLALMIELVCSAMTGAAILAPALLASGTPARHRQNGMVLAIDFSQVAAGQAEEQVEALIGAIKSLPPAAGSEILMPGERGALESARRSSAGIPLDSRTARALADSAASMGIAVPWK
jgi:LDH2 family malate/lactate/ureidoglycolate dehydrogenase